MFGGRADAKMKASSDSELNTHVKTMHSPNSRYFSDYVRLHAYILVQT